MKQWSKAMTAVAVIGFSVDFGSLTIVEAIFLAVALNAVILAMVIDTIEATENV